MKFKKPPGKRALERPTRIGHLMGTGGTECGSDDAFDDVGVVDFEHPGCEIEQSFRFGAAVALQGLGREISHVLIGGCQQLSAYSLVCRGEYG